MQIRAAASQPPVPRTTAVSSHGHLSVRGYDDNDDEDEDDGDDIYVAANLENQLV